MNEMFLVFGDILSGFSHQWYLFNKKSVVSNIVLTVFCRHMAVYIEACVSKLVFWHLRVEGFLNALFLLNALHFKC